MENANDAILVTEGTPVDEPGPKQTAPSSAASGRTPTTRGSSVVNLARTLNLQAVAEGVETEEQRTLLRGIDCELAQGFYFSKPSTAETASALLEGRSS